MKRITLLLMSVLLYATSAWAQIISVTIVDGTGTNAPFDTYGTRNNSVTPNTLTTNKASGLEGVVLSAPVIDRATWWNTYCLALRPSATQTAETVTITAPKGYLLKKVDMTAQANSDTYPYDVVFNGSTTNVTGASAKTFSNDNIFAPSFSFTINHTAASFHSTNKWLGVKSMTLELVKIVTRTSDISANKSYMVKCDRSAWAVANDGKALSTIGSLSLAPSIPDAKQRFAFVTPNGTDYYLYSVKAGKFLHAENNAKNGGSWVYGPNADKVYFADASSFKANTWRVYLEGVNKNINVGGSNQVTIDDWATADAGCAYYLIEAADVDGAALVERLKGPISVTWNVVSEGNGETVVNGISDVYRTEKLTLPSSLTRSFCDYEYFTDAACTKPHTGFASDYSGSGTETIYAKYTFSAPFTVSESFNTATWYYLKLKDANYPTYVADGTPNVTLPASNAGVRTTQWAFFGNPYDGFTLKNRAAGNDLVLGSASPASDGNEGGKTYATLGTSRSQTYELWFPASSTHYTNGFFLNNGQNYALNQRSTANMAFWTGGKDAGSTFVVEAAPSDAEYLTTLRDTYTIAAGSLDKPGFPTTAAYTAFRSAIEAYASIEDVEEHFATDLATLKSTTIYPNGTYYIKNRHTGCYAFITDDGELVPRIKIDNSVSHANNNYLWTVTSDKNAGTCNIVSSLYSNVPFAKGDNTYSNITSSNRTVITTLSTELFSSNNGKTGAFYLNGAHNNNDYDSAGNGNSHVISWNYPNASGSQWIFEPVDLGTKYTVTVEGLNDGGQDAVTLSDGTIVNLGTGTVYLSETPTTSNITQSEVTGYSIQDGSIVVDNENHTITVTYSPPYDVLIANYWADNNIAAKLANAGKYGYPALTDQYTVALNGVRTALNGGSYTGNAANYNTLKDLYAGFLAADVILPPTGKFYRFKANATSQYMGFAGSGKQPMVAEGSAAIYFYTSGKQFVNYNSGRYLSGEVGNAATAIGTEGPDFKFYKSGYSTPTMGTVRIQVADNSNGSIIAWTDNLLNDGGDGNDARCEWVVEDVTKLPVTISAARYATLYAPVALTIPTGVTAYVATVDNVSYLHLEEISGGIIPAKTGVILKGEAGTYDFGITTGGSAEGNVLTGTVAAIARPSGSYILSNGTNGVGFYGNGELPIPGFKSYLAAKDALGVRGFLGFNFDDPTAISVIEAAMNAGKTIYDLSGRRVENPVSGLYIVNGKKVFINKK